MTRRANGEGSISKYKDGRWCGRYWVQAPDGKKKRVAIYGKTKAEVRIKLTKAMADRDTGLVFDAKNQTLKEYLSRWLSNSVRDSVRQRTYERYEQLVRDHINPALGRVKLKSLTPAHVQGLYREKLDSGLSPRTVRYVHVSLHKALKQAVKWGLIPHNVAEAVDPPRLPEKEMKPLAPDQAKVFLEAVKEDRLEALYVLAVSAGLRQGELLGLKWEDIDLDHHTLRVKRTLSMTKKGATFVPPKSAKGRRNVTLTTRAVEALKKHKMAQEEEARKLGNLWEDHGLVFPNQSGKPLHPWILTKRFKKILEGVGLPEIRFHDLRHTCATLLLSKGIHPKIVQEILGHSTISITLDTYSHLFPNMQSEAVSAMEDMID